MPRALPQPHVNAVTHTIDTAQSQPKTLDDLPALARQRISEHIGRDQQRFHAQTDSTGATRLNGKGITARFSPDGIQIGVNGAEFEMRLTHPAPVAPSAAWATNNNRVQRTTGHVTEWLLSGPAGLQHGFTLSAPPGPDDGDWMLTIALRGATARAGKMASDLTLEAESGDRVGYNGLLAFDADGRGLPASFVPDADGFAIRVQAAGARYPITVDPWFQLAKLTHTDAYGDEVGYSVAISGNVIVVGTPFRDGPGGGNQGAAYVFQEFGAWLGEPPYAARLTASDSASGDKFGRSVAISGDVIVVGAPNDTMGVSSDQGSAYVYVKPGSGYRATTSAFNAKLTASDGAQGDYFGDSVAISGDVIAVGAPNDAIGANQYQGSAYVFVEPGGGWAGALFENAKLTASDGAAYDTFGGSVAISGDGIADVIVVGAAYDTAGLNSSQGSAYVFMQPGGGWATTSAFNAKLTASDGAALDSLGYSVAISGDVIVVGALNDDFGANTDQGSAYVFVKPGGGWATTSTFNAKLTSSDGAAYDSFGRSVAISGDVIVVGAYRDDIGATENQGSAYVFVRPGGGWAGAPYETAKLAASDGAAFDEFGFSVDISGDVIAVGAHRDDFGAILDQGSAFVFVKPGGGWAGALNENAKLSPSNGAPSDKFGFSVAIGSDGIADVIVVGVPNDNIGANTNQGSAYVFVRPGGGWAGALNENAKLTASDGVAGDQFGIAVDISGGVIVIGAPYSYATRGSAYVFVRPGDGWAGALNETAKLTASDGASSDYFGGSAGISGDVIVVGALYDTISANQYQGSAYVFVRPGGGWATTSAFNAKLTASDGLANDDFGGSVDISGDVIAVGASGDDIGPVSDYGSVYVFVRPGGGWATTSAFNAKLLAFDGATNDYFGYSVAISGDVIAIGVPYDNIGANTDQGSAYVFVRPGGGWAGVLYENAKLTASDGAAFDNFGVSVAISGDIISVSAPSDDIGLNTDQGSAYVFVRLGSGWATTSAFNAKLTASDGAAYDSFGISVAISGDVVVVGAPSDTISTNVNQGSAYVFGTLPPRKVFVPNVRRNADNAW